MVTSNKKGDSAYGFSLIELIIVISILSMMSALSAPLVSRSIDLFKLKSSAYEILNSLKSVRQQAILRHTETVFILDINQRQYQVDSTRHTFNLPDNTSFTLSTAESELIDEGRGQIRFFDDGSSTGGRISLAYRNKKYDIDVQWLNGQITMLQLTP